MSKAAYSIQECLELPKIASATPRLPPRPLRTLSTSSIAPPVPPRPNQQPHTPPPIRSDAAARTQAYKDRQSTQVAPYLLRRFNSQVSVLVAYDDAVRPSKKGRLDLNPVELDEARELESGKGFKPERLRAEVERAYSSVWTPLKRVGEEVVRLGNWGREWQRCLGWTISYFLLWGSPIGIFPSFLLLLAALILYPESRNLLFPLESRPSSGNDDDLSTADHPVAPEIPGSITLNEVEAKMFAQEFVDLAEAAAAPTSGESPSLDDRAPPSETTADISPASSKATTSKNPSLLSKHALTIQYHLSSLSTTAESLSSALSPPPPFESSRIQRRLALHLIPIIIVFVLVPPAIIARSMSAMVGVVLFGRKGLSWLIFSGIAVAKEKMGEDGWNTWLEDGQLQNALLLGAPSSVQVVIRKLRDGERAGEPVPAVIPLSVELAAENGKEKSVATASSPLLREPTNSPDLPAAASETPLTTKPFLSQSPPGPIPPSTPDAGATNPAPLSDSLLINPVPLSEESIEDVNEPATAPKTKVDHKARFATFVRTTARLGEQGAGYVSGQKKIDWDKIGKLAVDQIKTTTGSDLAIAGQIMRSTAFPIAALESPSTEGNVPQSSSVFYGHRGGAPGHLVIGDQPADTGATRTLSFIRIGKTAVTAPSSTSDDSTSIVEANTPVSLRVSDIISLRKTSGFGLGWKGRLAAGWMLGGEGESGGAGGLEIEWRSGGSAERTSKARFTAIARRDELFNRLASIGSQEWKFL